MRRANRLIQQKSLDSNQLSLEEVLTTVVDNSFAVEHKDAYLNEIQQIVNVNVLKYIMNLAVTDRAHFQVNAVAHKAIMDIARSSLNTDAYSMQYVRLLKQFNDEPEEFKISPAPTIPDGSPIGTDMCSYKPVD